MVCGTQPASVAAREAPTAAPIESASCSTTLKFSADPTPRPPDTITDASCSDGLDPLASSTRSSTLADLAASDNETGTDTSWAAPAAGAAATELARRLITGVPLATFEVTVTPPPKMDCLTLPLSPISTASAKKPVPSLNAVRAATSL